jgi:U11-48K-like CHHC zinc finger
MEGKIACVYNHTHIIKPEKLVWHYVKCEDRRRLQHLYSICPYDSTHHVPNHELDSHIQKCRPPPPQIKLNFGEEDPWG